MAGGGPAGLKGLAVADHGRGLDGRGRIGHPCAATLRWNRASVSL